MSKTEAPACRRLWGFGNVAQKTVLDHLQHQKTLPELKRTKFEVRARAGARARLIPPISMYENARNGGS